MLIRRGGIGAWSAPELGTYPAERDLQRLLAESPGWLPGVSHEARTVRELSTSAGPLDICAVDVDGSVTVVECKLAVNSEPRRMVIGQVLDYASAIWRDGPDSFIAGWTRARGVEFSDWLVPGADEALRSNLEAGRFGLCLAVDAIDEDIRRLVEFLSRITTADVAVTAIQLSYARDGDVEILIPTTFGGEIADAKTPKRRGDRWTYETFLAALTDPAERDTAEWLLAKVAETRPLGIHAEMFWWGARPGGGVFLHVHGHRYASAQLWVNKAGALMVCGTWNQYGSLKDHPGFSRLASFLGQPDRTKQISVPVASLDHRELWDVLVETSAAVNAVGPPAVAG